MAKHQLLRNRALTRLVVGIPEGHEHIRARLETAAGDVITLQEATVAALVRAYTDVAAHPTRHAVELRVQRVEEGKEGFATHQLLEFDTNEALLRRELAAQPPGIQDRGTGPGTQGSGLHAEAETERGLPPLRPPSLGGLDSSHDTDDGPIFGDTPTFPGVPVQQPHRDPKDKNK